MKTNRVRFVTWLSSNTKQTMPTSYLKKDIIKRVTVISAIAFMLSIVVQFGCSSTLIPDGKEYFTSLFIGVFASGIVVVAVSIIDYRNSVNHSRRSIIQFLLDMRSSILRYTGIMDDYKKIAEHPPASLIVRKIQYRITEEYGNIISYSNAIRSALFLDQGCINKESLNKIQELYTDISNHILELKAGLLFPIDIKHLGQMIDGQKKCLLDNDYTGKIEVLILELLLLYDPRSYETIRKEFRESYDDFFLCRFHWTD
jgi:hypothetical protein